MLNTDIDEGIILWINDETYGPDLSFTMKDKRYLLKMDEDIGENQTPTPDERTWRRWRQFGVLNRNHCRFPHSHYATPFNDDPRRWKLDDDDDSTSTMNWRLTDRFMFPFPSFERSDTSSLTTIDAESGIFSHSRGIMLRSLFFSLSLDLICLILSDDLIRCTFPDLIRYLTIFLPRSYRAAIDMCLPCVEHAFTWHSLHSCRHATTLCCTCFYHMLDMPLSWVLLLIYLATQ